MYALPDGTMYPEYLVPKEAFFSKMSVENLLDRLPDLEVIRRSDKPAEETFNELGLLRQDVITEKELPNLSLHMLGGGLKTQDIKFVQKKPASDPWPSDPAVDPYSLLKYVEIADVFTPVFFPIIDLHNLSFPYRRGTTGDKQAKKLREQFPEKSQLLPSTGEVQFVGTSKVTHVPTQLNYWHAELQFVDVEGALIKNTGSAWRKNAMHSALGHFVTNAARPETRQEGVVIPEELYIR